MTSSKEVLNLKIVCAITFFVVLLEGVGLVLLWKHSQMEIKLIREEVNLLKISTSNTPGKGTGQKGQRGDLGEQGEPCNGQKGEKGDPGEQGEPGQLGLKGSSGAPGYQGQPGRDGRDGRMELGEPGHGKSKLNMLQPLISDYQRQPGRDGRDVEVMKGIY